MDRSFKQSLSFIQRKKRPNIIGATSPLHRIGSEIKTIMIVLESNIVQMDQFWRVWYAILCPRVLLNIFVFTSISMNSQLNNLFRCIIIVNLIESYHSTPMVQFYGIRSMITCEREVSNPSMRSLRLHSTLRTKITFFWA